MKVLYKYNETKMELKEAKNGDDYEFNLTYFDKEIKEKLIKVKQFYSENGIITDLLVYTHADKRIQIIVRSDFYYDFILQLFKYQILDELKWID